MKRKIYIIIGLIIILVLIVFFVKISIGSDYIKGAKDLNLADNISMTVKKESLTNTSLTLVITDLTGVDNNYDKIHFEIDMLVDNEWKILNTLSLSSYPSVFSPVGFSYVLDENNSFEMDIDWESKYGVLDSGDYRIVIDVNAVGSTNVMDIVAEFTIE